jgi:hypothetical protein
MAHVESERCGGAVSRSPTNARHRATPAESADPIHVRRAPDAGSTAKITSRPPGDNRTDASSSLGPDTVPFRNAPTTIEPSVQRVCALGNASPRSAAPEAGARDARATHAANIAIDVPMRTTARGLPRGRSRSKHRWIRAASVAAGAIPGITAGVVVGRAAANAAHNAEASDEGRVPSVIARSSHACSRKALARRSIHHASGSNHRNATAHRSSGTHSGSPRSTCASSCASTAQRCAGVQPRAERGSTRIGRGPPRTCAGVSSSRIRSRIVRRTPIRARSASRSAYQSASSRRGKPRPVRCATTRDAAVRRSIRHATPAHTASKVVAANATRARTRLRRVAPRAQPSWPSSRSVQPAAPTTRRRAR